MLLPNRVSQPPERSGRKVQAPQPVTVRTHKLSGDFDPRLPLAEGGHYRWKLCCAGIDFVESAYGTGSVAQDDVFESVVGVVADPVCDLGGVADEHELLDELERDCGRELAKVFGIEVVVDQVDQAAASVSGRMFYSVFGPDFGRAHERVKLAQGIALHELSDKV